MAESTLSVVWLRVIGKQSRLFVARLETDSRVVATVRRTADALVVARTPARLHPATRRARSIRRRCTTHAAMETYYYDRRPIVGAAPGGSIRVNAVTPARLHSAARRTRSIGRRCMNKVIES